MSCPICGAKCKCRKRGEGGICCGCHRHKAQRTMTTEQLTKWRTSHGWDVAREGEGDGKKEQGS